MKPRVLVVGSSWDVQTAHQIRWLNDLGAEVLTISADLAPHSGSFQWDGETASWNGHAVLPVHSALIRSLPPIYLKETAFAKPLDWPSYYRQFCLQRDRSDAMLSFLMSLESQGVPCWNPPSKALLGRRKPYQLQRLKNAGCPVPDTLVTNDPVAAQQFVERYREVIAKPVAGGALTLNAADLPASALQRIRTAPAIFQQRINGDDIRVTVIEEEVVSAVAIMVPAGTLDFRGNQEYAKGKISYQEIQLPSETAHHCIQAKNSIGYRYAGIDLKRTPEGKFVFLECNNSPIYLDVERKAGHPITQKLCECLMHDARGNIHSSGFSPS